MEDREYNRCWCGRINV